MVKDDIAPQVLSLQRSIDGAQRAIDDTRRSLKETQREVNSRVSGLSDDVQRAINLNNEVRAEIRNFRQQFVKFVEADRRARNMQFAQMALVDVRAQLDRKFGHHDAV